MPTKSFTVGPGSLVFGETGSPQEMAAQITSATVSFDVEAEDDIPVLTGEVVPGEETFPATLAANCLQDISLTGINTWSWANKGTVVPVIYIPNDEEERSVVGEIKVRPIGVGGDVKKKAQSDFEFPFVGDPSLADVVP